MSITGLDIYYDGDSTTPVRTEYRYTWPSTIPPSYTFFPRTHYHCVRCNVSVYDGGRLCVACSLLEELDQPEAMRAEDV